MANVLTDCKRGNERVEPELAADVAAEATFQVIQALRSSYDPVQTHLLAEDLHLSMQIGVPRKAAI